jgi:hypothetical protein
MAEGFKDFVNGVGLDAADLEDYCELQAIMRFASAATRTTQLSGVLTEGLASLIKDANTIGVYSGSAWSTIGPVYGAPLSWTPVVVQGATPSLTVTTAAYTRTGRWVQCNFLVTITSAGTAATDVTVSLPVTAAAGTTGYGNGFLNDASPAAEYPAITKLVSTTTMKLRYSGSASAGFLGSSAFTAALANGDTVEGSLTYIAASDA